MEKAHLRGNFRNLKQALKVMPDDFQLSSSDSAAQLLRKSSESLIQLRKKIQPQKEEKKSHLSIIEEKKEHKKNSSISSNNKKENSKENTIQVNNIINVASQDGYRALMNQIVSSKIDIQGALFNNKDKKNLPNQSMNNSTTMVNESPIKAPILNGMKNWLMKKMTANNEATKAKLEAAKKRRAELTHIQDMDRAQLSKVNMTEKVDEKIKSIRRQNMRKFL